MPKKNNVTLTLDEEVLEGLRKEAAKQRRSVSSLVEYWAAKELEEEKKRKEAA